MFQSCTIKTEKFRWIAEASPRGNKKAALLIPQYNESSNCNFEQRLIYFQQISENYTSILDVIIIDDGSTDDSLSMLEDFVFNNKPPFYVASTFPNGNKVGALYATILSISHEFVILSDFDTNIFGLEQLPEMLERLGKDNTAMGGYFKMVPFDGRGRAFMFQHLEYSLLRTFYKYHSKDKSVPIMPGAGCCYKRNIIISIYQKHSGLRNGEDREATLLGLKMGYKALYISQIVALTRPPLSFRSLIKQRTRWYLGYIETLHKEWVYYRWEIKKCSVIGIRTLLDLIIVMLILSLFPVLLITAIINPLISLATLLGVYGCYIFCILYLTLTSPVETGKLNLKTVQAILFFPGMKICLECIAWVKALISFKKKRQYYVQYYSNMTDIYIYQQAARKIQARL